MDHETLAARLGNIYWLAGGSGAGKSTLARKIAAQYNMRLYATDDVMGDHHRRCDPQQCPNLTAFVNMDMDERWLNRSPQVMLETFHWFRGEAFHLIVEDLLSLPTDQPVIVEGFRLLPALVEPLLGMRSHAAWLIPTARFRRSAFISR
ncbi:MAG: hypothetical protein JO111_16050, partial [Caulobacteraceae bacterium]|nr:hypothetical protein [Caulobacteraceae bacterium]